MECTMLVYLTLHIYLTLPVILMGYYTKWDTEQNSFKLKDAKLTNYYI